MLDSHFHPFDLLTQMSVRLQHHEGGVSGEDNRVGGMSIRTAAVFNVSVLVIMAVWKLTRVLVAISYVLVIPPDVPRPETYVI